MAGESRAPMRRLELPAGFAALTGRIGIHDADGGRDDGRDDVWIAVGRPGTTCAAVFTQNRFAGPSVEVSRRNLRLGRPRAAVVLARNANVANGPDGRADAETLAELAAAAAQVGTNDVLIASTGVIGRRYPMERIRRWWGGIAGPPVSAVDTGAGSVAGPGGESVAGSGAGSVAGSAWSAGAVDLATAMMTTDTHPKVASASAGAATVVAVAKGVGMIEPNMATMLAFAFTDAEVDTASLDAMWRRAVDRSFNCLSVDTDTSTSDTAAVFASGAAGPVPAALLAQALGEVCTDLTLQLARDGEGATKLLTVTVGGGSDEVQARRVAKAVVNSPLVKTAVHGADPNWGRVAMAIGKVDDESIDPDRVVIRFGPLEAYPASPGPEGLQRLGEIMAADHIEIDIELGLGDGSATVYGCDLSAGYVRINADYTT